jgi:hypothetical protein
MSLTNLVKAIFNRSENTSCGAGLLKLPPVSHVALPFTVALLLAPLTGCVERTVKIQSEPPGALATVNDEEVGATPVKFAFLWYGDYEIILRKPGYETYKTHCTIKRPWYEVPPIDLVAETLVPTVIKDDHVLGPFALEPAQAPTVSDVIERATELRDQTLCNEPE